MIYFDNAATTVKKPPQVIDAVVNALSGAGNSGRGGHGASLEAARTIFAARQLLAELFNAESPERIAFTANSTQALNTAINGIVNTGDHIITTELEHNSVLRPLYEAERQGAEISFVKSDKQGKIRYEDFEKLIKPNTRAIVCTHASNLTGNVLDIKRIGEIARRNDLLFVVDASQSAGVLDIGGQKMNIDILCFTGHKGLLAPQGTGGIYLRGGVTIRPLLSGGSGVQRYSKTHPRQMPTALEAGTLNCHGIAGLKAAVEYINSVGMENIRQKEQQLMRQFYDGVKDIPGVKIYGDFGTDMRCAIVALNVGSYPSEQVSDALFRDYGIATRAGAHCAPLMHKALGTEIQGAVRFSFSHYNTAEEVECAVRAFKDIAE